MRRRLREGCFRCRPPRYLQLCLVIFIIGNLPRLGEACKDNEALQCNTDGDPSDCSCVKCPSCPPGEGLYPQCMGVLKANTTMKCLPCPRGMFSDKNDFGACHACHDCTGHEIVRECNATHNRICKKGCKDGFQQNDNYPMCEKIPHTRSSTSPPKPTTEPPTEVPTVKISTTFTKNAPGQNQMMSTSTTIKQTAATSSPKPMARSWPTPDALPAVIPSAMPSNNSGPNRTVIKTIERIAKTPDFVYVLCILLPIALFLAYISFKKRERIKEFICDLFHWNNSSSMTDNQVKDPSEAFPMIIIKSQDEERRNILDGNISSPRPPNPPGQDLEQNNTSDQHTLEENTVLSPPKHQDPLGQDLGQTTTSDVPTVDQNAVSSPQRSQDPQGQDLGKNSVSSVPEQQRDSVEEAMMCNISDLDGGLLLCELTPNMKSKISVKISKRELTGWKEIGEFYEIPKDKIEEIETRCSYGSGGKIPGECLFDFLACSKPKLSIKDFTEALHAIKRYDVINH